MVIKQFFSMNPHLHVLVVAQVMLSVTVYAACITGLEAGDFQRH